MNFSEVYSSYINNAFNTLKDDYKRGIYFITQFNNNSNTKSR